MYTDQNAGQNHNINMDKSSLEIVEQFRYLCNNPNKTKLHWKRNEEQFEFTKSLLLFGTESLTFQCYPKV
jgi:hypothetical protein